VPEPSHFIVEAIEADLKAGTYGGRVVTRFPPEPNGFLHIGHAKAILVDHGMAERFGGRFHLRFDDTNPLVEETRYVDAIQHDMAWLGCDWGEHLYYASDYFPALYEFAQRLIREGKAYVCSLSEEEIRATRGTVTEPGTPSPDRDRPAEESLRLLEEMRIGMHPDGSLTVRARIDMASPNMKMRDPLMYRIRNVPHHRTGDAWHIYPMYDYAHGLSDAIEGVTHSFCTLEFENNRELYDWFVEAIFEPPVPRQYEFARLALTYVVMSKRMLIQLVQDGHVWGWDDPRMPSLAGLRRRGVPAAAIRAFIDRVGVARTNSLVDMELFEHTVRDYLNTEAPRRMGVLRPLPIEVTNWDADRVDWIEAPEWPHDVPKEGSRKVAFTRHLVVDREDFAEAPPKGWKRLAPGVETRLRHGYLFTCDEVVRDGEGAVIGLRGRVDLDSRGGNARDGRKVKGTVHWVSASEGIRAKVRLVDRLFAWERPEEHPDGFLAALNPDALVELDDAVLEPSMATAPVGARYQLERVGYFVVDSDSEPGRPVLHRTVALKDSWGKKETADEVAAESRGATDDTVRRRTRRSADDQLAELLEARPELEARIEELGAAGLSDSDAVIIGTDDVMYALLVDARSAGGRVEGVVNWLVNDVRGALKDRDDDPPPGLGAQLAELVTLIDQGDITSKVAKQVFAAMLETGDAPAVIVDREGLRPLRDPVRLRALVDEALAAHPDKAAALRAGRTNLRGFFVGQIMRSTGGKADPAVLQAALDAALA
jgi:glutaminyl-tRNA synthetase